MIYRKFVVLFGDDTLELTHIQNDGWIDQTAEQYLYSDIDSMVETMREHR